MAAELERPWMKGELRGWIACTDGLIDPERPGRLVGANMAVSRRVMEKVPAFDVELGPGALGYFDDTLFGNQLMGAGYRIRGALDVAVVHYPDVDRLDRPRLAAMARRLGRSSAYQLHHWEHGRVRARWAKLVVFGAVTWLYRLASVLWPPCLGRWLFSEFRWAYIRQFMIEVQRPRNYEKRGLVKRGLVRLAAGAPVPLASLSRDPV